MTNKKTLVIGASLKPERYSNRAIRKLLSYNHPVVAIGLKEGVINGAIIEKGKPDFENIDTVTMYINPHRQEEFYEYIISLKPKRIIFNPGTENAYFKNIAQENGIEVVENCTLVMLDTGLF